MPKWFNIRHFLWWLSFFLYGMYLFQISLKKIWDRYMKKILRKRTASPIKWVLSWTITTAVLQSSSVVTLIIISLVWVNVISFTDSIWVIIGTNIWTTITARIISIFWFKLNLQAIALPIIAVTWIVMVIFTKKRKLHYSAVLAFWFWLLLFGINFIKDSFWFLDGWVNIEQLTNLPAIAFLWIWFIITALAQSTAISNTIAFTAIYSWLISFKFGMLMVIWANIWTTTTAILWAINWTSSQKQVAWVHVLYNIVTASVVLILLNPIHTLLFKYLNLNKDVIWLAAFHTSFNLLWALIFFPFIKQISKFIKKIIPNKKNTLDLTIETINPDEWEVAILAVKKDTQKLFYRILQLYLDIFHIKPWLILQKNPEIRKLKKENFSLSKNAINKKYNYIKNVEEKLLNYTIRFEPDQVWQDSLTELSQINQAIINFTQSISMIKEIKSKIDTLYETDKIFLQEQMLIFKKRIWTIYNDIYVLSKLKNKEEIINKAIKIQNIIKNETDKYTQKMSSNIFKSSIFSIFKNNPNTLETNTIITINRYISESSDLLLHWLISRKLDKEEQQKIKNTFYNQQNKNETNKQETSKKTKAN